jgi:hypothetical protein
MEDRQQGLRLATNEIGRPEVDLDARATLIVTWMRDNAQVGHVEPEDLQNRERIFIARTLRQAKKVEALLTAAGVDYDVEVEPYGRSLLFGTIRHGAAFYVAAIDAAPCRERLVAAGFWKGVVTSDATDRD